MKPKKNPSGIKSWNEDDRPREKLLKLGKHNLSDKELIAILIRNGSEGRSAVDISNEILNAVNNDLNQLGKMDVNRLVKFAGIGPAKAITLIAGLELAHRRKHYKSVRKVQIKSSHDVYELLSPYLEDLYHEEFWIVLLNRNNRVIKTVKISSGGVTGTVVDHKIIFKEALANLASAIILCHNHPSGNLKPSQADIKITSSLKKAGELLEIKVLDHLIISEEGYFSFADESYL